MVNNTIIPITGMHRSGTSLMASWLESCGLVIHNGQYWGAGTGNLRGHFEDKEFVALHESAIIQKNPESSGWKINSKSPLTFENNDHVKQASILVETRNGKYKIWGWKDPRSTLYLDCWKKLVPSLKAILIWRPCGEVVRSLIKRSQKAKNQILKIGLFDSIKLWKTYNSLIYEYKKNHSEDTLLYPLTAVTSNDQQVLSLINLSFCLDLEYRSIDSVYDRTLLNNKQSSFIFNFICRFYGSLKIEAKLNILSENFNSN